MNSNVGNTAQESLKLLFKEKIDCHTNWQSSVFDNYQQYVYWTCFTVNDKDLAGKFVHTRDNEYY